MKIEERELQEILELIWTLAEELKTRKNEIFDKLNDDGKGLYRELITRNWIVEKETGVEFTDEGRKEATRVIRRHRLAEVLFTDLFALHDEDIEKVGCTFEHILFLMRMLLIGFALFLDTHLSVPMGKRFPRGNAVKNLRRNLNQ